uniref:Uncharacterized protein n=1 Tax=Panagrolaimus sp. JU765 TaxID=591449 RepID=A0AC34Q6A1_9BILA
MNAMKFFALTLIAMIVAMTVVDARHHHKKRVVDSDLEYRDMDDYQEYGVFVDAVPIKTTPHPKNIKNHHKSNRLSKMKKFFSDSSDFYH